MSTDQLAGKRNGRRGDMKRFGVELNGQGIDSIEQDLEWKRRRDGVLTGQSRGPR